MGESTSRYPLWVYLLKVGEGLVDAWAWPRDTVMIPVALLISSALYYFWRYGNGTGFDWRAVRSTVIVSLITLVVYAFIKSVVVAWRLDVERAEELAAAYKRIEEMTPKPDFRGDVLRRSTAILDFFFDRAGSAPPQPVVRAVFYGGDAQHQLRDANAWLAEKAARGAYDAETLQIYDYRFARDTERAVELLRGMGLEDSQMNGLWRAPGVAGNIKVVGQRLAILAERIQDRA